MAQLRTAAPRHNTLLIMKLLVLLAVLGAVSAQYKVYTGVPTSYYAAHPGAYAGYAAHPTAYAGYSGAYAGYPATYAGYPGAYAGFPAAYNPTAYAGHPYGFGLPLSFKPAEEKKTAAEPSPVVESRSKRSADDDQKAEDATFVPTYATYPYPLTYTAGYPGYPYNVYPSAAAYRPAYNGGAGFSPLPYHGSPAYGGAGFSPLPYHGSPANGGAGFSPLPYHGCVISKGAHGCNVNFAAPAAHSLKKRDTAAAEDDQQADEATFVSTYAGHPLAYTAGYPYTTYNAAYNVPSVYNAGYNVPSVYSAGHATPFSGFPYNNAYTYRTFY